MKRIFIVDDVATNLLMAKTALDGSYETFALSSAERMFKLVEKITPDLILLDVDMPDMDGFEAIQVLKSNEELKSIPVIFLTGKIDTSYEIRGFELGALDFIYKPFTEPVLLKRIETHIEMDKLLKSIQIKNTELEAQHDEKINMLCLISHDLKNYVGVTATACDMLIKKCRDLIEEKYMKMANKSIDKAISLIDDLIIMSKIDIKDIFFTSTKINLNSELDSALENFIMLAKEKGVVLDCNYDPEPIYCMINIYKFQRIINNLCSNVIKFASVGGSIEIKTTKIDNVAHLHIKYSGVGINEDILSRLFQHYQDSRLSDNETEASTVVGLYIVKQLIRQHNGTIEVQTIDSKTSEFIIKLPVHDDEDIA